MAHTQLKNKAMWSKFVPIIAGLIVAGLVIAALHSQYLYAQALMWIQPASNESTMVQTHHNETIRVSQDPRIIIPKLNVDAPIVYGMTRTDEPSIQKALERGVLHFANTSRPGERGNAVFVGHSSNDVWAPGDYKFVFALLERLEEGDEYALHYDGVQYVYRVSSKKVVLPSDVSVLSSTDKAESTLITCTPTGTNLKRLVIRGTQTYPSNIRERSASSVQLQVLPGN